MSSGPSKLIGLAKWIRVKRDGFCDWRRLSAAALVLLVAGCSGSNAGSASRAEAGGPSGAAGQSGASQGGTGGAASAGAAGASQGGMGGVESAGAAGASQGGSSAGTSGFGGAAGTTGGAGLGGSGGDFGSGGQGGAGGSAAGAAGAAATAGSAGVSGAVGPCDLYQAANTPCVAAHSTVRALYGSYAGKLYQVRRASDKSTRDIAVLDPGGYADSAAQDTFCAGTTCTISRIYDQSPKGNHLAVTPPGGWLSTGGTEANATSAKIVLNGHAAYGVYTTGSFDAAVGGVGYRNNATQGVATGDQPEGIYMVVSGKHYNQWCCFDYGNAETNNLDDGSATMEAVYFGNSTQWGKGSGTGPWVMADLENGVFAGQSFAAPATNTSLVSSYVTAMLKGKAGGFTLKGGDAQAGKLKTMYDGPRPSGYDPMKKQGAIILGIGGDNSHTGEGTFYEGCMTSGYASDAVDDAVQANIVAAGYGR